MPQKRIFDALVVHEVQETRAQILDEIEALNNLAKAENRNLTGEEVAEQEARFKEWEDLAPVLARAEQFKAAKLALLQRRSDTGGVPDHGDPLKPPAKPLAKPKTSIMALPMECPRLRAFSKPEDAYLAGRWLAAVALRDRESIQFCQDNDVPMLRRSEDGRTFHMDAQTVDDDSRGGYLVPAPLAAAILAVRDAYGVARRVARLMPMASETLSVAKRAGGLTVYSPSEGSAITTSEATWSQVSLTTIDRFTLTRVSRKLLRSAIVSIADQVAMEIGQAFGEGMDNEFINGDGTGTYFGETGVVSAIGAAGVFTPSSDETWSLLALTDFTDTAALLPGRYHNANTAWICSRAFYASVIEKLMIAAGGTTTANIAAGGQASLLGYPIYFTEKMPTATAVSTVSCLFGDFYNGVMIGERQGIEIALSEHRYFDSDEIGIRGKISYDINVHGGGDGSDADAYVALKTAAS